jgi:hypothetical protein
VIDEHSPLFGLTREGLQHADFELIMTVEGIVEATGMTFQARTSFLPDEIQWGYRYNIIYPETGTVGIAVFVNLCLTGFPLRHLPICRTSTWN